MLTEKQVRKIEGGHWARLIVRPFYYPQQGGGVTLALTLVQYIKPDESFAGKSSSIDLVDELEVSPEDLGDFMQKEEEPTVAESLDNALDATDPMQGLV